MSRDITLADTIQVFFTTRAFATGIPTVLAGTPVISAYEDASLVQITAGVTLTVSHDGVVGLNRIQIVATGANGFESGKDYHLVITTGTVGGVSVVGEVVGDFTIEREAAAVDLANATDGLGAIKTETAAILADVTGIAGAAMRGTDGVDTATMRGTDSAALASIATEARLSELDDAAGKLVNVADAIEADTQNIQSRLPATLVAGRIDSSVGAMAANVLNAAAINAAAFTAAKFATDALDANALAADFVDEIRDGLLPTQNAVFDNIMFLLVAASDHVTPVTGATGLAVTRSIDSAAFGAGTGTLAEVANGIYQYDASAADMNGGIITFRFVATGGTPGAADDRFLTIVTGGGV